MVSDADTVRFAAFFEGREGVHARMWAHPRKGVGYSPVERPFDADVARAHLDGQLTAGLYLVRKDQTVLFGVFDLDARKDVLERAEADKSVWAELQEVLDRTYRALHSALVFNGVQPLGFHSGRKGRHLWVRFREPVPARRVRSFMRHVLGQVEVPSKLNVEVFPKQDRVEAGGLGNLVKLPLGIHLATGRRAVRLSPEGEVMTDGLAGLLRSPKNDLPVVPESPEGVDEEEVQEVRAARLLAACPMVRSVYEDARRNGRIARHELLVLHHTLGHLPDGVALLQGLYDRIADLPDAARLTSPLRGNPTSCSKVRKRLSSRVGHIPCACVFPEKGGDYEHPLRHLDHTDRLDDLIGRLAELRIQVTEVEAEVAQALAELPDQRWTVPGGSWVCGPDRRVVFVAERS